MLNLFLQVASLLPPTTSQLEPPPPFELTSFVDDASVNLHRRRCITALVRITNVDRRAHPLPGAEPYMYRLELVDAHNGYVLGTFGGSCSGGRDRDTGRLVPPGGFVDQMVTLPIGPALDDRVSRVVRVRYKSNGIEHLRTFVPIIPREPSSYVPRAPDGHAFDVPAMEMVGPIIEIWREPDAEQDRHLRSKDQIQQIEGAFWQRYSDSRPSGPLCDPPVFYPVHGVCIDAEAFVAEITAVGPHESADDALFQMSMATWVEGDLEYARVFIAALETRYAGSTGYARVQALRRFGDIYGWSSCAW